MTRYRFGHFEVSQRDRTLYAGGVEQALGRKAVLTLLVLLERPGEVVEKAELMRRVWPDVVVEENNLDQCLSALRRALDDRATAPRFIETVHRRGYRFVAGPVERIAEIADRPAAAAGGERQRRSLAILPFLEGAENEADGAGLGAALADALIARFAALEGVAVRSSGAVSRFSSPDRDALAAGRALEVDHVVAGRLRRQGGRLRLSAELVSVEDGVVLWADRFDESIGDLFVLEDRLCQRVFDAVAERWQLGVRLPDSRPTDDVGAYQLYFQGRHFANQLTPESFERSRRCFERAIELDPRFARAHAGLSYLYINAVDLYLSPRESLPPARAAAERALEIAPDLSEALSCLGCVAFWYDRDGPAAEAYFRRAIVAAPNLSIAHFLFGWFLALHGRGEEATPHLERGAELDPFSLERYLYFAAPYYFLRRFDVAEAASREAVSQFPDFWLNHAMLARCREALGRPGEAIAPLERALALDPGNPEVLGDLGRIRARLGDRRAALAALDALRGDGARSRHVPPFCRALVRIGLGEFDAALDEIERSIEERSWMVSWIPGSPVLDPLRSLPRFQALRRRAGF